MPERSSYEGVTGLADDFDGTIVGAVFINDPDYLDGKFMTCNIDIEGTSDEGESVEETLKLSTGSGWEPAKKGTVAVLEKTGEPAAKGFGKNTNYHLFVVSAVRAGAGEVLEERGESYEASIWEDLEFHFLRGHWKGEEFIEGVARANPVTGETADIANLMPVKYLGIKGEKKKAASKGAGKASAKKAKDDEEEEDEPKAKTNGKGPISKALELKLKKAANSADDHDDFIEKALLIDGVDGDDEVTEMVADSDYYESLIS